MALIPFEEWASIWPTNVSVGLSLEQLIGLINRRFSGKPVPPTMPSSASRSIWNDISANDTTLPQLIRLLNRRLGGVRIPMTEDALVVEPATETDAGESVYVAGQINNVFAVGSPAIFQVGTNSNYWNGVIKRYGRRVGTTSYTRLNCQLEPRALVDPRYPGPGYRLRARECCALVPDTGIGGAGLTRSYKGYWGFGGMPNASNANNVPQFPFVGFRTYYLQDASGAVVTPATWFCRVVDDGLNVLYNVDTGLSSSVPQELQLLFDGEAKTVYFYVNDSLKGSYTFASNTAPGQVTPYPGLATAAGFWNMLWTCNSSNVVNINHVYNMSPATPLITFEYTDEEA